MIESIEELYSFIERKKEPKDDEAVYLDEDTPSKNPTLKGQVLVTPIRGYDA